MTAGVKAGNRDRRIVIESLTEGVSDSGELTETAETFAEVWAEIVPLSGRELWTAQQSQATTTHKITMIYRPGLTAKMRATYSGRTFNFDSVANLDEANRYIMIMATEVV